MKYIAAIMIVALSVLALDVFSKETEQPTAPLGVEQIDTTDQEIKLINQPKPRRFDQLGQSTGDVETDKQVILEAANRVPSVKATSVEIKGLTATITAEITEPMNAEEAQAWEDNIKSAIEGAIQKYEINVIIK
ncbi:hypothetical protein [Aquibacillus salsiterrae]|uniref:Uncharacterized protein n=1 Tax=Aquibacillus salsiterrae TaxID=2950439 RepID=A0A9X4AED9_9BACI|nr:hypothetical protein [Aquibacillus salsiterrae]MDC3416752.1 hypothetical protein [Aquibacillus salsiterrae]